MQGVSVQGVSDQGVCVLRGKCPGGTCLNRFCPVTREVLLLWISRVGSDARINQLEVSSPESCLSWLRSHKGCPQHDLFTLEYSKCENCEFIVYCLLMLTLSCQF